MSQFETVDMFTDKAVAKQPHAYFEHLRQQGPSTRLPTRPEVVAVTGYDAGLAVFRDDEHFSAINATTGPIPPLPFKPEGEDITAQIEAYRAESPAGALIVTQDAPSHANKRAILNGIITPVRLKQNEAFMVELADRTIDEFVERGSFEMIADYAQPFATLVIADLLGVPEEDHKVFRTILGGLPGEIGVEMEFENNPLARIGMHFVGYIAGRRANPRDDVLTTLAQQTYGDGSIPDIVDVVTVATFLFGAGQDTTIRTFAAMLRFLTEDPGLQRRLRADRKLIPDFVEEVLRLEGTAKTGFRLAKVPTKVGGLEVEPGTHVMLMIGAMNRDPAKFPDPAELRLDRKNVRDHVSFGRGAHSCIGAPLARAECRVTLERLFDRTSDIRLDETKHGPQGERRFDYMPNYLLRGLTALHLDFDRA